MWILFYGEFLSERCLKSERFRKGSARIRSTPQGPARLILSVCETPRLDGDKGRGPRFGHQRCFPWQRNVFGVRSSFCSEFQKEAVIPETGKCHKQYGSTWPLLEPQPPPAAAERCCLLPGGNTHNWPCVCARVFVLITEQSVGGGDLIEQMWPMYLSLHSFFNYSFKEQWKCFTSYLQT